ncbi:MAG: UPF0175 family protein [Acidobacteria bacterium]|nr:UPF0175 family protein [Acidobacteriota bacterium]
MDIVLTVPDQAEAGLKDLLNGSLSSLPRRILELATIRAYEMDSISEKQVMTILGFSEREQLYKFFKENDVKSGYTVEDLEKDSEALAELLNRQ